MVSEVWKHFTKLDNEFKKARCKYCDGIYSYKTTVANIKRHLYRKHKLYLGHNANKIDKTATDDEDSNHSLKYLNEVSCYFELEGDEIHCTICGNSVGSTIDEQKTHLEDDHPGVLARILKDEDLDQTRDSDNDQNSDKDIFTEVIYLDRSLETNISPPKKKIRLQKPLQKKQLLQMQMAAPVKVEKLEKNDSEMDCFLSYLKILLKKVPRDLSSKLQRDIINLVINTTFSDNNSESQIHTNTQNTSTLSNTSNLTAANGFITLNSDNLVVVDKEAEIS